MKTGMKKCLTGILSTMMVVTMMPLSVFADTDATKDADNAGLEYGSHNYWAQKFPRLKALDNPEPGETIHEGVYYIDRNIEVTAKEPNQSGLVISGNVVLVFEKGAKLKVKGGDAKETLGGGAGIELKEGNSLRVKGNGKLEATGGSNDVGQKGQNGQDANDNNSGDGGAGGNGGGGGGAAIGTKGGNGGEGGALVKGWDKNCVCHQGQDGNPGSDGVSSEASGKFAVSGNVEVEVNTQNKEQDNEAAKGGKSYSNLLGSTCGGGGGGASGMDGFQAHKIGVGGPGGSGGGSGSSGGMLSLLFKALIEDQCENLACFAGEGGKAAGSAVNGMNGDKYDPDAYLEKDEFKVESSRAADPANVATYGTDGKVYSSNVKGKSAYVEQWDTYAREGYDIDETKFVPNRTGLSAQWENECNGKKEFASTESGAFRSHDDDGWPGTFLKSKGITAHMFFDLDVNNKEYSDGRISQVVVKKCSDGELIYDDSYDPEVPCYSRIYDFEGNGKTIDVRVPYKVCHYFGKVGDDGLTPTGYEHKKGADLSFDVKVADGTDFQPKDFKGYYVKSVEQKVNEDNGSTEIDVYYEPHMYSLVYNTGSHYAGKDRKQGMYVFLACCGAKVEDVIKTNFPDYNEAEEGYSFAGFSKADTIMPAGDLTIEALWKDAKMP